MAMCVDCGGFVEEGVDDCPECEGQTECEGCGCTVPWEDTDEDGYCEDCVAGSDYAKQVADDYRFMTRP